MHTSPDELTRGHALTGRSLVSGAAPTDTSRRFFHAVNPSTGESLEPAYEAATPDDVERAARAAEAAFRPFSNVPNADRAAFLKFCAAELEGVADPLVHRAMQETALPEARLRAELTRTIHQFHLFADAVLEGSWRDARIDLPQPQRAPVPKPDVRSLLIPLGPVVVFGASNFPLAFSVPGGDTVSAFAAGCPVIVKAHPAHPGTSELAGQALVRAVRRAGLPDGVFSLLFDDGVTVGVALTQHPAVKAVAFTGSRQGGLALVQAAQARSEPIPVYAELGSVNPIVFTAAALQAGADRLVAGLAGSICGSIGQLCTQPGLLFVPVGEVGDAFLAGVASRLAQVPAAAMLTERIHVAYTRGLEGLALHADVQPVPPPDAPAGPSGRPGRAVSAHLFQTTTESVTRDAELTQELFGPVSVAVRYDDMQEVVEAMRGLEGQLTATVHAAPHELPALEALLDAMRARAGRVVLNGFPTGVEVGHAMMHGGPFPATSDGRSTSVGTRAMLRFTRPLAYQDFPDGALPLELRNENPLGIQRLVDGQPTREPVPPPPA